MTTQALGLSAPTYARTAGVLYLLIAIIAGFSIGYVPNAIVVAGDAAATAANLDANKSLFAAGVAGDVAIMLIEIALSVMLYMLLRPVNATLALISMIGRLAEVMVMAVNVLINVVALLVLSRTPGAAASADAQSLVMLLLDAHAYGIFVWDILFGFSLAVLGYLVARSGYLPRLFGWGMAVGSLGYLIEGLGKVTFVEHGLLSMAIIALLVVATVSELGFAVWLLVRGVRLDAWNRAARPAMA